MIEEQELLADQHAVLTMDARDLRQQPLELGRKGADTCRSGLGGQLQQHVQGDLIGMDAENLSGRSEQRIALTLDLRALAHLNPDVGEAGQDTLHVLLADRLALGEHDLQQAPVRRQLPLEVFDQTVHHPPLVDAPADGEVGATAAPLPAEPVVATPLCCASIR